MKKRLIPILALLLLFALLAGCGAEKAVEFDTREAADALFASDAFSDILSPIQPNIAAMLYNVDAENIESCSSLTS